MRPAALRAALSARARLTLDWDTHRRAGVLVPLFSRGDGPRLVFTLRGAGLPSHAGQISFPGGSQHDEDADLTATALREAHEEIGIDPASVEILGLLDDLPTPTGFVITPVVGWLEPAPAAYRPNPGEVAEVFELTLAHLREPGVFQDRGEIERWGLKWRTCAYVVDGRDIWGATARMVRQLLEVAWPR